MRDLRRLRLAALLVTVATTARSQTPDEQPTNFVPGMVVAPTALPPLGQRTPDALILARPDVQADLRLTAAQRRKFARFGSAVRERQAGLDEAAEVTDRNVFAPLPMPAIESFEENQAAADDEIEAGIAAILTRPQRARFAQIRLQLDGPMAFLRADLLERLGVDDDQADAIRAVVTTAREEIVQNPQFPLTTRDVPRRDGRRVEVLKEGEATLEGQLARARVSNDQTRDAALGQVARILRKPQWEAYIKLRGTPFAQARAAQNPAPAASATTVPRARQPRPEAEPD